MEEPPLSWRERGHHLPLSCLSLITQWFCSSKYPPSTSSLVVGGQVIVRSKMSFDSPSAYRWRLSGFWISTPLSTLTFQSRDTGGRGCPQGVMAPVQVCQAQFPGRLQGRRPSGTGRVKSAFQPPGEKGGGRRDREEEKQTGSVCRRHTARYTTGALEGRRGLPGARLIPTPARGLGRNVDGAFLHWGQQGRASHVRAGSVAQPPRTLKEGAKVSRRRGTGRGWTSEGSTLSSLSLRQPTPLQVPGMLSAPPPHLRRRQEFPRQPGHPTCGPRSAVPQAGPGVGGLYLFPAPGPAPAPRLAPPRSLQLPRSLPGTVPRPRAAASKPAPEGRRKREAGS